MSEACERWASVADRRLVGDDVSAEDARFAEAHAAECELCGAEARIWQELESDLDEPAPLEPEQADALIGRTLAELPRPPASLEAARQKRQIWLGAGVAAALAVAAGVILWLRPATMPVEAGPHATLSFVRGEIRIDGKQAGDGAKLSRGSRISSENGRGCITWPGNVRACVERQTEVVLAEVAPNARRLELERGLLVAALDPLPSGDVFAVTSGEARVEVKGTVFSVTRSPSGPAVVVRVHEGVVAAQASMSGPTAEVTRDEQLSLATGERSKVASELRRRDLEIAGVTLPEPAPVPAPLPAPTAPAPQIEDAGAQPERPAEPDAGKSAADLLKEAQSLRAQGNSAAAAAAYRRLQALYPRSAEAQASRVSLAELLLARDPAGALAAYDAYLRGGGALRQEAEYGRIVALGRLGRAAEERSAIEAFVARYPNSVQARTLSKRLGDAGP